MAAIKPARESVFDPPGDNIIRGIFGGESAAQAEARRLERSIDRLRTLLNDPAALRRRADALVNGTAKPLLAFAIVGLFTVRMLGGPASVPSSYMNSHHVRRAAAVAIVEDRRAELV